MPERSDDIVELDVIPDVEIVDEDGVEIDPASDILRGAKPTPTDSDLRALLKGLASSQGR